MRQPPVEAVFDTGKKPNYLWVLWVNTVQAILQALQNSGNIDYVVPLTGFAYQFASNMQTVTFDPAAGIAAGTVTLPANPFNAQECFINTTQTITTLTVAASVGNGLATSYATALAANTGIGYMYNLAQNKWFRIQ